MAQPPRKKIGPYA